MNLTRTNDEIDRHEDLHLMVKVLSKIYLAFGKQVFINRSMDDPFYFFVVQTSLKQLEKEEDDKKKNRVFTSTIDVNHNELVEIRLSNTTKLFGTDGSRRF